MLRLIVAKREKLGVTSWTRFYVTAKGMPKSAELFLGTMTHNLKNKHLDSMFQVSLHDWKWPGVPNGAEAALCRQMFNQSCLWQVWSAQARWSATRWLPRRTAYSRRTNGSSTPSCSCCYFMWKFLPQRPCWILFSQPNKPRDILICHTKHHLSTIFPKLCPSKHTPTRYGVQDRQCAWDWGQKYLGCYSYYLLYSKLLHG